MIYLCALCDKPPFASGLCRRHYNAEYHKKNYAKKREYVIARVRAYAKENQEKIRATKGVYYSKHSVEIRSKVKEYREKNKEKVRDWKAAGRKRDRIAIGSHDYLQLKELRQKQKNKCSICKKPFGKKYHKDHIVPLFLGGTNYIENIQYLCALCNTQKNKKDPIQFMQEKGFLL